MKTTTELGWIKIHRQITQWEWFDDANTFKVFIYLLISANHETKKWMGKEIKRGQLVTSKDRLAEQCNLSRPCIRGILGKLEKSGEIEQQITNKFTIITIKKYEDYQGNEKSSVDNSETPYKERVKSKSSKKKQTPLAEPASFTDPTVQSKEQSISQDIDVLSFWNSLLGIYNPEGDKSLHNPALKKQREKILKNNFTKDQRDFILTIFAKYLPQLNIVKPWIGTFFRDHDNMDKVADYFRSIKEVKETSIKPKYQTRTEIKRNILTRENSTPEDF